MLEFIVADVALGGPDMSADEALALDLALGILVEPLLGVAEARRREDADFRRLVERIETRLSEEEAINSDRRTGDISPRPETWNAILTQIAQRKAF
jgi:anti-sigma-K factor RskA